MGEIINITSTKDYVTLKIYNSHLKYAHLIVRPKIVISKGREKKPERKISITRDLSCGDCRAKSKIIPVIYLGGILAHYIVQELRISNTYRKSFINMVKSFHNKGENKLIFQLIPGEKQIIDYAWNERTTNLTWERVELDHALSWLSTLGGAFSALGDYFSNCAVIAGKISFHQLKLALRLGDPTVASRCRLYFSLSLIQRGYLKEARNIIYQEYHMTKNAIVVDIRLVKMCLGIWAKLKYEYERKKKHKLRYCCS